MAGEVSAAGDHPPEVQEKRPKRGARGRVVLFGTWCKGCGLCAALCPVGVLALDGEGRPYVVAAEKCTACHWCDTHCPDFALIVKPVEKEAEGGGEP